MGRFIGLQGRGTIALPPDIRRKYGLDVPGAQVEVVERDDGVIELHPHVPAPILRLSAVDSEFFARVLVDDPEPTRELRTAMKRATKASPTNRTEASGGASDRTSRS